MTFEEYYEFEDSEMFRMVEAKKAGKIVEYRLSNGKAWLLVDKGHRWNFERYQYRIKNELKEIWVRYINSHQGEAFTTRGEALQKGISHTELVHFKEVKD